MNRTAPPDASPRPRPAASLAAVLATALCWGCVAEGGASGAHSLSSAQPEAAGDHCPAGGQRILTGVDLDGNGLLEASEVQRVAYVCNRQQPATCTTLEGSVVIRNPLDWATLVQAGCTRITGTLEIVAPGVTSLGAASPLVQVGRLEVWGSAALTSLRFPALAKVDDAVIMSDVQALTDLQLPALALVGSGGLQVAGVPLLTAIDLPALTTVEGTLALYDDPRVARVSLPKLATVGELTMVGGTACTALRLPALATARGLYLTELPQLQELDLPVLASVGTLIVSDDPALGRIAAPALATAAALQAARLPALAELDLPELSDVAEYLALEDLPALTRLALPAVRQVGFFTLDGAARLTALELPSLVSTWYLTVRFPRSPSGTGPTGPAAPSALTSIGLPALVEVGVNLSISGAASLELLELPLLTSVGSALTITDNPALPQCQADAVLARLLPPLPAQVTLTGNDGTVTCP